MKKLFLFIAFLFLQNAFGQIISEEFNSTRLNGKRQIAIYLPENYSVKEAYSLFVVLDAASLMEPVISTVRYYELIQNMPKSIVVGVFNTDEDVSVPEEVGRPMNESARFFEFVGAELVPYIRGKYAINDLKGIVATDEAGYMANHYLLSDKPLFSAVITLNPKIQAPLGEHLAKQFLQARGYMFYYMATTNLEDEATYKKINDLNTLLKGTYNEYVNYKFDNFEGASAEAINLMGIAKAFDLLFDVYKPISTREFKEKIQPLNEQIFEYLETKYNRIQKELGVRKKPTLNDIFAIYDATHQKEDWNSLIRLAEFVKANGYVETAMPNFFLGEYYEKTEDYKRAIRAYQRAYAEPNIDFIKADLIDGRITELRKKTTKTKGKTEEEPLPEETPSEETTKQETPTP
ncbi:MAG: alpha/beta hydrolase-fold protein [Capnocytophaga sp.]|nr:alpha/beta hydrolase-fold protein [Capnocytophaga sp.]